MTMTWRKQWHGSGEFHGWSIMEGDDRIAFMGRTVPIDLIEKIIESHNNVTPRRLSRIGAYLIHFAKKAGWKKDSGEGAFEYVQRISYEQGQKDGRLPIDQCPTVAWLHRVAGRDLVSSSRIAFHGLTTGTPVELVRRDDVEGLR